MFASDNLIKAWEGTVMVHFNLFNMGIGILNLGALWVGYWWHCCPPHIGLLFDIVKTACMLPHVLKVHIWCCCGKDISKTIVPE